MIAAIVRRSLTALLAALALTFSLVAGATAQEAAGDWKGSLSAAPGTDLRIAVHLQRVADALQGALDSPDQAAYGVPITASVDGGKLSFTVPTIGAAYAATWDPAAHAWSGVWTQGGRTIPLVLAAGAYPPPPVIHGLDGEWDGVLDMGAGLRLRLAFHIKTGPHGTLGRFDSVDEGAYGSGVSAISREGDSVRLDMKLGNAAYVARLVDGGQTLVGLFTRNDLGVPLTLKRLPPGQSSPWPRPSPSPGGEAAKAPAGDWKLPTDAEIAALLATRIDTEHQGVGAVVGVVDNHGRRVVVHGKGDSANARPLDGDTEFEIGSITKVFTALTLADMAARGEVKLDDPIALYLPPGVSAPQKDGRTITLLDLATHTSGLPRLPSNMSSADADNPYADYTRDQLWRFLSGYQLTRDPGDRKSVV